MRQIIRLLQRLLKIDFVRFCLVGTLGFGINAGLLLVLNKNLHSPFVAQLIASEIALFSNFIFHHKWTYRATAVRKTISKLIVEFHLTSWTAIIGSAVLVTVGIKYLHLPELVALAISSALALFWNFAWSRFVIWRKRPRAEQLAEAKN